MPGTNQLAPINFSATPKIVGFMAQLKPIMLAASHWLKAFARKGLMDRIEVNAIFSSPMARLTYPEGAAECSVIGLTVS
jgi:hypothetical protein